MSDPIHFSVVIPAARVAGNVVIPPTVNPKAVAVVPASGRLRHRSDTVANVSYCGKAAAGSLESSAVWTITRITVAEGGSVTTATANAVKWTERLTETYT